MIFPNIIVLTVKYKTSFNLRKQNYTKDLKENLQNSSFTLKYVEWI